MNHFPVLRPAVVGSCLAGLVAVLPAQDPDRKASLERAAAELPPSSPTAPQLGDRPTLRLVDVSLNLMTALGTSTERDSVLADLRVAPTTPRSVASRCNRPNCRWSAPSTRTSPATAT